MMREKDFPLDFLGVCGALCLLGAAAVLFVFSYAMAVEIRAEKSFLSVPSHSHTITIPAKK